MPSFRTWMFLAALAAVAAGPGARRALADSEKDELAEGDWTGEKKWDHMEGGGGAPAAAPAPTPGPATPPPGGTATPPDGGGLPPSTGTPTEPTGPAEPTGTGPAAPDPSVDPGPQFPPSPPPPLTPYIPTCNARWVVEVEEAPPTLFDEETMLTLTLFRTDAFAFISNGYCRAESTWFVDGWATTQAGHDGLSRFTVEIRLDHPCPNCQPKIDLKGISQIQARVQAKTPWGGLNSSTMASAAASTLWAGDIDCGDRCSAAILDSQGTGEISVGADPLKVTRTTTKARVFVSVDGGKGDAKRIDQAKSSLLIVNHGAVSTYAAGTDDNAQAKCRVGYFLVLRGDSACGKWGQYEVAIKE
jgi:hypothetical protein